MDLFFILDRLTLLDYQLCGAGRFAVRVQSSRDVYPGVRLVHILDLELADVVGHCGDYAISQLVLHRLVVLQPLHPGGRVGH